MKRGDRFDLEHLTQSADFVMRVRVPGSRYPKLTIVETRRLSDAAREAEVATDQDVQLTGSQHRKAPDVQLCEVAIVPGDDPEKPVRLLTTLSDYDASVIGLLYWNRWQVELLFRCLKCHARFHHSISHNRDALLLHYDVAVVGVTQMYLHTGHRPSKSLFSLMGRVASVSATMEGR